MDNQPVGDAYDPSYKMKVQTDCFTVVHESERMREVVMKQHETMKKFTPSKNKNQVTFSLVHTLKSVFVLFKIFRDILGLFWDIM